jgi:hypothetical protein
MANLQILLPLTTNLLGTRFQYDQAAANLARQRTLGFLDKVIDPSPQR